MDNSYTIVRRLGIRGRSDCYLIEYGDGRRGIRLKTLYQGKLLERNIVGEKKVKDFIDYFDRVSKENRALKWEI